jgi:hypothetical protein
MGALLAFGLAIAANFAPFARVTGSGSSLLCHVNREVIITKGNAEETLEIRGWMGQRSGGAGGNNKETAG